jgi:hypothetical protein
MKSERIKTIALIGGAVIILLLLLKGGNGALAIANPQALVMPELEPTKPLEYASPNQLGYSTLTYQLAPLAIPLPVNKSGGYNFEIFASKGACSCESSHTTNTITKIITQSAQQTPNVRQGVLPQVVLPASRSLGPRTNPVNQNPWINNANYGLLAPIGLSPSNW